MTTGKLPPTQGPRLAAALGVAALVAALVWAGTQAGLHRLDFDYYWLGGVATAQRQSPYEVVAEAVAAGRVHYPYNYPGPTGLLLAPFGLLPQRGAYVLWSALGAGLLAYGITRDGWWRLGALVSAPFWVSLVYGQTAGLTTAAAVLPWVGFVYAAKPSLGLALWAAWPTRQAAIGSAALFALSLLWLPGWPAAWWANVGDVPYYVAPIRRPFGWLLLLAWLRWRTPGGRLLGMLAVVPHTTSLYEMLPLLLLARNWRELLMLLGGGWLAYWGIYTYTARDPADVVSLLAAQWPFILGGCYLPALWLVLRREAR